jgi:ADP-ribose pyrophosphatase
MTINNKSWEELDRHLVSKARVFDLYAKRMRYPRGEDLFYFLDSVDYVNVIPITHDNQVVLVKQYRHGVDVFGLEIPGGMVNDRNEAPEKAALRELEEETGYVSSEIVPLGWIHPNPAIQNNRCHIFLAKNVSCSGSQNLDQFEDITVHLYPLHEIPSLIERGVISHALIIASFFMMLSKQKLAPQCLGLLGPDSESCNFSS